MTNTLFKLFSQNVRGMRDKKKREKLYHRFRDKGDIIFVQESHCTSADEIMWENEWNGDVYFSNGSSNSKGVMILVSNRIEFECKNVICDSEGRFILMRCVIKGLSIVLCNIYAPNQEGDHHSFLVSLKNVLHSFCTETDELYIMGGDMNFVLDVKMDRSGGNPHLWKKSVIVWNEICDLFDLIDIWRIRHPECKMFTWHRKQPALVQSRIDQLYVSDNLQVYVENSEIHAGICSDHSALLLTVKPVKECQKGASYWRFNNKLIEDELFICMMKEFIELIHIESQELKSYRCQWDYMKFRIKSKCREYSIRKAKLRRQRVELLENNFQTVMADEPSFENTTKLEKIKLELNEYYDEKMQSLAVQSRCQYYEKGEKSTKYFLNLIKRNKTKTTIRKLKVNDVVIEDRNEVMNNIKSFYKSLYSCQNLEGGNENSFINDLKTNNCIPTLTQNDIDMCKSPLFLSEVTEALNKMNTNKSPGNDGLSVEFYRAFWPSISNILLAVFQESITEGALSASQRQSVITLLEKNGKDKLYISNWRPISLINVDTKLYSKCIANRFKSTLPRLIHENQVAYINERFIGEGIELIDGVMSYVKDCKLPGILMAIDFAKAFDSLHWTFIWESLKAFGFPQECINMIKVLYTDIESCVMNDGVTTGYFPVRRGVKQGDPLSAYLFILAIEILAIHIRQYEEIHGIKIDNEEMKLSIYADDITVFVSDVTSAKLVFKTLELFRKTSGLSVNLEKTEAMWIGCLTGNTETPLGVKWSNMIKITGIYFSTDKTDYYEMNYRNALKKMQSMCNLWRQRNLSLLGKIQILKTYAVSQLNFITNMIPVPNWVVSEANKIMYTFLWNDKPDKIKRKAAIRPLNRGGLGMPDIESIINTQRLIWFKRFFCNANHPWTKVLSYYLKRYGGPIILQGNLSEAVIKNFPAFYREMLNSLMLYNNVKRHIPVLNKCIWFNQEIKKPNGTRLQFNKEISLLGMNTVYDLYNVQAGHLYTWDDLLLKGWKPRHFIMWCNILHCIPVEWKNERTLNENEVCSFYDIFARVTSKSIAMDLIDTKGEPPSSELFFERKFNVSREDWGYIYNLPFETTIDSKTREFQLRINHNIVYSNDRLSVFHISDSPLCKICKTERETLEHMFCLCERVQQFWTNLRNHYLLAKDIACFEESVNIILGYYNRDRNVKAANHIMILAKKYIYDCRSNETELNLNVFHERVKHIVDIERKVYETMGKLSTFNEKWSYLKPEFI